MFFFFLAAQETKQDLEPVINRCYFIAVPVRWTVRVGGDFEPERNEPRTEPVARVLLLRTCIAEHLLEDMGRQRRERESGSGDTLDPCQSQFAGSAREIHRRR